MSAATGYIGSTPITIIAACRGSLPPTVVCAPSNANRARRQSYVSRRYVIFACAEVRRRRARRRAHGDLYVVCATTRA